MKEATQSCSGKKVLSKYRQNPQKNSDLLKRPVDLEI